MLHMEVDARMADREREASYILLQSEARNGLPVEPKPRVSGRALPQWLKHPPFVLRFTHR